MSRMNRLANCEGENRRRHSIVRANGSTDSISELEGTRDCYHLQELGCLWAQKSVLKSIDMKGIICGQRTFLGPGRSSPRKQNRRHQERIVQRKFEHRSSCRWSAESENNCCAASCEIAIVSNDNNRITSRTPQKKQTKCSKSKK